MMISAKPYLPIFTLVLVVFTVFTVSLTETIQISDGFRSQSTAGWVYELNPGESQVGTWTLINTEETPINIEFNIENNGSELFVFEKVVTFEPKEKKTVEFIVSVPDDHPDNVEYHVKINALEKAPTTQGGAAAVLINYQMFAQPIIKIGDDPVFTPEPKPVKVEEEPEPIIEERPSDEDLTVEPVETIEEKLKRIEEANKALQVDDVFEEEAVPELQIDDSYIPEPVMKQDQERQTDEVKECDFFAMILSWFGIGKC